MGRNTLIIGVARPTGTGDSSGKVALSDDPGHAVAAIRGASGKIVETLSFGPSTNRWGIVADAQYRVWEIPISSEQFKVGIAWIADFENAQHFYWPGNNCVTVVVDLGLAVIGTGFPFGLGLVNLGSLGYGVGQNPASLAGQMNERYGEPQVWLGGQFPNP